MPRAAVDCLYIVVDQPRPRLGVSCTQVRFEAPGRRSGKKHGVTFLTGCRLQSISPCRPFGACKPPAPELVGRIICRLVQSATEIRRQWSFRGPLPLLAVARDPDDPPRRATPAGHMSGLPRPFGQGSKFAGRPASDRLTHSITVNKKAKGPRGSLSWPEPRAPRTPPGAPFGKQPGPQHRPLQKW